MAVVRFNFLSRCLGRQVDVSAVIPSWTFSRAAKESVDEIYKVNRKHKVLILLNGFSGDHTDYLNYTNIARYAEDNGICVFMPSGLNSAYRDREDGDKMHSFVAKELLQVVRYMFPVSTKRKDTYIGGLSMGAAGASTIGLAHPETFSKIFCMSGVTSKPKGGKLKVNLNWFGEGENLYTPGNMAGDKKLVNTKHDGIYSAKKIVEEGLERPEIYLTIGDKDFLLESTRSFKKYMDSLGYDIYYEEVPGYGHEWDFWDAQIKKVLDWLPLDNANGGLSSGNVKVEE